MDQSTERRSYQMSQPGGENVEGGGAGWHGWPGSLGREMHSLEGISSLTHSSMLPSSSTAVGWTRKHLHLQREKENTRGRSNRFT